MSSLRCVPSWLDINADDGRSAATLEAFVETHVKRSRLIRRGTYEAIGPFFGKAMVSNGAKVL